jgi:hypothetical protein
MGGAVTLLLLCVFMECRDTDLPIRAFSLAMYFLIDHDVPKACQFT